MTDKRSAGDGAEPASAEAADGSSELDSSEAQRFFLAVEEHFLRLRGAPMMLSPGDWRVARAWRRDGVPLQVAQRVIERVFEQRRERGATGRVSGLRYFDDAVRSAWAEILELRGPESPSPARAPDDAGIDVAQRLQRLAGRLPEALPERERWRRRILEIDAEREPLEVEHELNEIDRELVRAARQWSDAESLATERREVEQALSTLRGRLDAAGLAEAGERLLDRRLRDRFELPELSLFASS